MKLHTQVLVGMALGIAVGVSLQALFAAPTTTGLRVAQTPEGLRVQAARGPAQKAGLRSGDVITGRIVGHGTAQVRAQTFDDVDAFERATAQLEPGAVLWLARAEGEPVGVSVVMRADAPRASAVAPFGFLADIFMALLKMLIVPIVFVSIVLGVAGLDGQSALRRIGLKAFAYYTASSLLAIVVGQVLVNLIAPGDGAQLGLSVLAAAGVAPDASFVDVVKRAVPENVVGALANNGAMLQIIFFALLLGYSITKTPAPHGPRVRAGFESALAVVMVLADLILRLIPVGVFVLLVKVVATTGFAVFRPLLLYMLCVVLALVLHAALTLALALKTLGKISPLAWAKAMSPALLTAFSTSSSSMTLPVTMETVEKRGRVSNPIASFTLPLGATINMDGTALYECIGVIFLAQYYASAGGFELTLSAQALVVVMALLASIGAAGIPSAGLVMMLTILSALGLPLEGAALLLSVDRPLDMLRTTVNVWSDTCAAAIIARSEGENPLDLSAQTAASSV